MAFEEGNGGLVPSLPLERSEINKWGRRCGIGFSYNPGCVIKYFVFNTSDVVQSGALDGEVYLVPTSSMSFCICSATDECPTALLVEHAHTNTLSLTSRVSLARGRLDSVDVR